MSFVLPPIIIDVEDAKVEILAFYSLMGVSQCGNQELIISKI